MKPKWISANDKTFSSCSVSQSSDENETKSDKNSNNTEGVSLQDNGRSNRKSKQINIEISFKRRANSIFESKLHFFFLFLFFAKH